MTDLENGHGKGSKAEHDKPDHPQEGPDVTVSVDGHVVTIHRGRQTVAAIKKAGNVPATYELEQVIDGKLVPLPDDGALTIKGGETFFSHPKDSSSS